MWYAWAWMLISDLVCSTLGLMGCCVHLESPQLFIGLLISWQRCCVDPMKTPTQALTWHAQVIGMLLWMGMCEEKNIFLQYWHSDHTIWEFCWFSQIWIWISRFFMIIFYLFICSLKMCQIARDCAPICSTVPRPPVVPDYNNFCILWYSCSIGNPL